MSGLHILQKGVALGSDLHIALCVVCTSDPMCHPLGVAKSRTSILRGEQGRDKILHGRDVGPRDVHKIIK